MSCSSSSASTIWPFRLPIMYFESLCSSRKQTTLTSEEDNLPFDASTVVDNVQGQARRSGWEEPLREVCLAANLARTRK